MMRLRPDAIFGGVPNAAAALGCQGGVPNAFRLPLKAPRASSRGAAAALGCHIGGRS